MALLVKTDFTLTSIFAPREYLSLTVADLGEGPPLFWQKKKKQNNEKRQKEEKPAGQAIFANVYLSIYSGKN